MGLHIDVQTCMAIAFGCDISNFSRAIAVEQGRMESHGYLITLADNFGRLLWWMRMGNENRVLAIGLDGGTFELLTPLMQNGHMPNLKGMMENGVSGELLSTVPPVTPPAWSSFMTGKNPDKRGVFGSFRYDRLTRENRVMNSTDIGDKTIWKILSEKARRSAW